DKNKYDRDRPRFSLKRSGDWCRVCEDGVGSRADQLFRKNLHPINVAIGPTIVDPHVATVRPTQLLQRLNKCCEIGLRFTIGFVPPHQYADAPHSPALLRARREPPRRRRAAEQRDELALVHSMTSSARASSVGGISMPRPLAVCRLMTSSNFVGSVTGRSAGFSPLRIRPA